MVKSIVIEEFGGPEVLKLKDTPIKPLQDGEILIKQNVLGLNFIDIQHRRGANEVDLPCILGSEACGVIEDIRGDIPEFAIGDRVAYATSIIGAYTEARVIAREFLVPVPDYINDEQTGALLLKGMTAHYLLRRTFFANKKNTILVHAAAGGVGQLLCMLAKYYGSKVIAVVGSEEKRKIVESIGVDLVINRTTQSIVDEVLEFTGGNGVHVVYDSIGKDTLDISIKCLSDFGLLVSYGASSGNPAPIDISRLASKSLFMTRPSLFNYKKHRAELLLSSNEVFSLIYKGVIKPNIYKKYNFIDIQQAHLSLENRKSFGQSIVIV